MILKTFLQVFGAASIAAACSGGGNFNEYDSKESGEEAVSFPEGSQASTLEPEVDDGSSVPPVNIAGANLHRFDCRVLPSDDAAFATVGCIPVDERGQPVALKDARIRARGSLTSSEYQLFRLDTETPSGTIPLFYGRVPSRAEALSFEVQAQEGAESLVFSSSFVEPGRASSLQIPEAASAVLELYAVTRQPAAGSQVVSVEPEAADALAAHASKGEVALSPSGAPGQPGDSAAAAEGVEPQVGSIATVTMAPPAPVAPPVLAPTPTPAPLPVVPVEGTPVADPVPLVPGDLSTDEKIQLCDSASKTAVVWPVTFASNNAESCTWDPAKSSLKYAGYRNEFVSVSREADLVLCGVQVSYCQTKFEAEDFFVLTLDDVVLAGNQVRLTTASPAGPFAADVDGLIEYDWASIKGYDAITGSAYDQKVSYCLGDASCVMPKPGDDDKIDYAAAFELSRGVFYESAPELKLGLHLIGDDDAQDCKHDALTGSVTLYYADPNAPPPAPDATVLP